MAEQRSRGANSPAEIKTEEVGLLDQILDTFSTAAEPQQRAVARDIVTEFARQVVEGEIVQAKDSEAMIKARIAQIDGLISAQLNEVMHAPEFQKLEASWRGLHYLVSQTETGANAEDQGLQRLEEGPASRTWRRRRSSTRARCSRRSTRRSTACSAARRSAR